MENNVLKTRKNAIAFYVVHYVFVSKFAFAINDHITR